jgi:Zn-dependent protease
VPRLRSKLRLSRAAVKTKARFLGAHCGKSEAGLLESEGGPLENPDALGGTGCARHNREGCDNGSMDSDLPVTDLPAATGMPAATDLSATDLSAASGMPAVTDLAAATGMPAATDIPAGHDRPFGRDAFGRPSRPLYKRLGGAAAAAGAVVVKFGAYLKGAVLLLPKLKLLTTAGTALVSVAAYSLFWGWPFAVGFVVLLFVHEMGHVIQLRREGIKASTPMFIPFMGALIASRSLGENALAEARVGLAGPVLGSLGAAACLAVAEATHSSFFRALAYVGFLINLFNLIPVLPLDGGRAMAAMAPWMWFVGFAALIPLALILHGGFIIFFVLIFGGRELLRRWRLRKSGSLQQAAYYRVAPRHRLMVGAVYVGLIVALAAGMGVAHVLSTGGHSFRSL